MTEHQTNHKPNSQRRGNESKKVRIEEQVAPRFLFQSMPPVCLVNEDCTIAVVNPAFCDFFEVAEGDVIGLSCRQFFTGHRCAEVCCAQAGEWPDNYCEVEEGTRVLPSGRRIAWVGTARAISVHKGGFKGVLLTFTDISEIKAREEAEREGRERNRSILDSVEDGYYEVDLQGNFTFVNQPICRFLGYSADELIGLNNRHYTDVKNAKMLMEHFNTVYATGKSVNRFEVEVMDRHGNTHQAEGSISLMRDKNDTPVGFFGIVRDISARKLVEAALRESEEKYRVVVENATEGILILQDDRIKYANPRMQSILEYDEIDLAQRPFTSFIGEEHREEVSGYYSRRLKGESIPDPYTFKVLTKEGEHRLLQAKAVLINWEDRPAVLSFLRDITAQHLLESKLQHAQKMEAIGTLAGGIAHEFNNILGAIVLNTELALDDIEAPSEAEYSLSQVLKASHRAKDLIEQILTFSRNAEVERRPLNLGPIVKETLKMLRAMIPSTIAIHSEVGEDIKTVLANPTQIQQLLINLCTNAAHAMRDKGGALTVRLRLSDSGNGTDMMVGEQPREYVCMDVMDTGEGIEPQNKERIFDPFFTTKRTGEGTGLGLSVVHGIVVNNEGTIAVDSQLGNGTTFTVSFPVVEAKEPNKTFVRKALPTGNKRILFADDEAALLDVGSRMLARIGYTVIVAQDGMEALAHFSRAPDEFDLVITDMTMPQMNGFELTRELLRRRPDLPIILCSGYSEKLSTEKLEASGIRRFVMKPYALQEIADAIQEILEENAS